jgi:hypothetical protein
MQNIKQGRSDPFKATIVDLLRCNTQIPKNKRNTIKQKQTNRRNGITIAKNRLKIDDKRPR